MRANWVAMQATVIHLFEHPQYRLTLAALIHNEFWQEVPGASVACMADRLAQAASAHVIPLCLVALQGGVPIGVVNLRRRVWIALPRVAEWTSRPVFLALGR